MSDFSSVQINGITIYCKDIEARKLKIYATSEEFNIDNTGVENASPSLSAIDKPIALTVGTYNIKTNVTVPFPIFVPDGATITINDGATFTATIINTDRYKIFDIVNGTVKLNNTTVFPEWFGCKKDGVSNDAVAIQLAINSIDNGLVSLCNGTYDGTGGDENAKPSAGAYYCTTPLTITGRKSIAAPDRGCIFTTVSPFIKIGAPGVFSENCYVKNLFIYFSGDRQAAQPEESIFVFNNATRCGAENVRVYHATFGFYLKNTRQNFVRRCEFYPLISTGTYTSEAVHIDATEPNPSTVIEDNSFILNYAGLSVRTGINVQGNYALDLAIRRNDFSGCRAILIQGTTGESSSLYNMDILIEDNIIDLATDISLFFTNLSNCYITVRGGWISAKENCECLIAAINCDSLLVECVQFDGDLGAAEYLTGVQSQNCNTIVNGCSFQSVKYCARVVSGNYVFSNNSIVARKNSYTQLEQLSSIINIISGICNAVGNIFKTDGKLTYQFAISCGGMCYSVANTFGDLTNTGSGIHTATFS